MVSASLLRACTDALTVGVGKFGVVSVEPKVLVWPV